jgi:hypothetical protein
MYLKPGLPAALDLVASYFDEVANREKRSDSTLIVPYHTKADLARAYVLVLGHRTRELFGDILFRTVATTASVALDRKIDWQQVRKWTSANLPRRK